MPEHVVFNIIWSLTIQWQRLVSLVCVVKRFANTTRHVRFIIGCTTCSENHDFVKILKMLSSIPCESKNFKLHYDMSMVRPRRALDGSNMIFRITISQYRRCETRNPAQASPRWSPRRRGRNRNLLGRSLDIRKRNMWWSNIPSWSWFLPKGSYGV